MLLRRHYKKTIEPVKPKPKPQPKPKKEAAKGEK